MAEITKWQAAQVMPIIRHNMRHLADGKTTGNDAIVPDLTKQNYSLIDRGSSCYDINHYRKSIEDECFKYSRKNIVHAIEVAIQCPSDCPPEQEDDFFKACYEFVCSTLPMGEDCVFVAQVHKDERYYAPNGEMISKDHLHIMYVPAVKDTTHADYEYKLCADALTKRATLNRFHPDLQKYLDEKGIQATVYQKKDKSDKSLGLSVKALKSITDKTGIHLNSPLTINDLSNILTENKQLKTELQQAQERIKELDPQYTQEVHDDIEV